jgi:putative redox protein
MATAPIRRIGRLEVEFTVPTPTTEIQRQKLIKAAETCPVHKSLHPDVEVAVNFHWSELVPA